MYSNPYCHFVLVPNKKWDWFLSHLHSHKIGSMFFWFRIYASAISQEIFTLLLNLVDFLRIWKITRYTVSFNENSGATPKKIWTHFMYLETVFLKRQIYLQMEIQRTIIYHFNWLIGIEKCQNNMHTDKERVTIWQVSIFNAYFYFQNFN